MALRKEQVLILAALAIGVLVWRGDQGGDWRTPMLQRPTRDYEPAPVPAPPLVTAARGELPQRTWFREPSETQPLPPTTLPWPERPPLFLVALPLDPGPDVARADLLRIPGAVTEGVQLDAGGAAEAGGDDQGGDEAAATAPAQESLEDRRARWSKVYDRVYLEGLPNDPQFGKVRVLGVDDRFAVEDMDDFSGVTVELLPFSLTEQRMQRLMVWRPGERGVVRIRLADNLRNEVGRRVRRIPPDIANVEPRLELIDWLLEQGKQEAWVYDVALEQARILEQSGAGLAAQRAKVRVFRARGDLNGELLLYQQLAGDEFQSFAHQGRGMLEARLGLHAEAEADLRRAVELAPSDPRPYGQLAQWRRDRGRPQEAAAAARKAISLIGMLPDPDERREVVASTIACLLGVGDVAGARSALATLGPVDSGEGSYLRACIEYTAGELQKALDGFRNAATQGYGPAAQLGLAACQLRAGEWQDAHLGLQAVSEQSPLLRSRALTGLALLNLRIGQREAAVSLCDRALEADPLDPYAFYLRGRALSDQGLLAPALDAMMSALRLRDDFVPVLAEVALLHLRMSRQEADAVERAGHALAAMRYADRANDLSEVPLPPVRLLAALSHFAAADLRGAAQQFRAAADVAETEAHRQLAQCGLVVVDYAMGRTDDARYGLGSLRELPPGDPIRVWAESTLLRIDDHAQKEQLDDHFEREEVGNIWDQSARGVVEVRAGELVISSIGTDKLVMQRFNAVKRAGQFLGVGVELRLGGGHEQVDFVGLRIENERGGSGTSDFMAQIGLRRGKPHVRIQDGREEPVNVDLLVDGGNGPHRLELRVREQEDGRQFTLVCLWGGGVVHEQAVKNLHKNSSRPLETQLVVEGRPNSAVDVHFDDYHLERRKDG